MDLFDNNNDRVNPKPLPLPLPPLLTIDSDSDSAAAAAAGDDDDDDDGSTIVGVCPFPTTPHSTSKLQEWDCLPLAVIVLCRSSINFITRQDLAGIHARKKPPSIRLSLKNKIYFPATSSLGRIFCPRPAKSELRTTDVRLCETNLMFRLSMS